MQQVTEEVKGGGVGLDSKEHREGDGGCWRKKKGSGEEDFGEENSASAATTHVGKRTKGWR